MKMFVNRVLLYVFYITILCFAVSCTEPKNVQSGCTEVSYAIENFEKTFDVKDIVTLNCGRVRRSISVATSSVATSNVTYSVNGSAGNGTNVTASNVTIVPVANVTASSVPTPASNGVSNVTTTTNTTAVPGTNTNATANDIPMPASSAVSNSTKQDVNQNQTASAGSSTQNPTKIDLKIPVHNLGENGTGIRHITTPCPSSRSNTTTNTTACVSEPIVDDEGNSTDISLDDSMKPEEKLFGEHNVTNFKTDYHRYYNSSMITDKAKFDVYWNSVVSQNLTLFDILSNSHKKAVQHPLRFVFPFYGQPVDMILITTGGFLFTGPNIHFWLSATHYIAPLMANFETSRFDDSVIRFYDNGTALTVVWENMTLNDVPDSGKFTFATTIFDDGHIVFAYKHLPLKIEDIPSKLHPVKIGLSDAYEVDHIEYFIRNKMILEYHQIDFKNESISNHTLIRLIPLPTCPQYNTCKSCLDNDSQFQCAWCSKVQRCSSGLDRLEQEWYIHNCHTDRIDNSANCSALDNVPLNPRKPKDNNVYSGIQNVSDNTNKNLTVSDGIDMIPPEQKSSSGAIVASLMAVVLVCGCAAWVVYAYRNPHTSSGQLLIKYRPSQWSWRRGEARYTAATIHM